MVTKAVYDMSQLFRVEQMRIAQARHLYTVTSTTFTKLKDKMCNRCGKGFDIGHTVLSRSRKAHSKYGVYHKKCAMEVNLLP
tara:strand:- start:193 stop:438 length:246 start_codon:yes stop_codon:yes gene_type:complete